MGEVWKICKNKVDEREKFFAKIEENIFGKTINPMWKYILWSLEWYKSQIFNGCGSRDNDQIKGLHPV